MRKVTSYEAYHDGKLIGAHESWRVYSHAVIVQDDIEKHCAWAYGYQPSTHFSWIVSRDSRYG
jgi:hypothetical protein